MNPKDIENPIAKEDFRDQVRKERKKSTLKSELLKFAIYLNTKGGRKSIQPEEIEDYINEKL